MPPTGQSTPAPPPGPLETETHDLATPEEVAARKRRRRLILWGVAVTLLLVAVGLGGLPTLRAIKAWQARRAAHEALRLLASGQDEAAVGKVQDALTLRGSDPEVIRSTAVFLTRIGHGREALGFWKEVEKRRPLSTDEQRDYATDLLQAGDPAGAAQRLRLALPNGAEGGPADWSLGLQIAARSGDAANTVKLARRILDHPGEGVTPRQRLDAAASLLNVNDPALQAVGTAALQDLARGGQSAESLSALLILTERLGRELTAQRARSQEVPAATTRELLDDAARIDAHPKAETAQKLLALQVRIAAQPDQRAALLQQAVDRYGKGKDAEVAALAAWLYAQGEYQRVLEIIPPQRATASRALYLQYLDTLGATGRWDDIRKAIEGQRFTLDPLIEQMYLARCAKQLNHPESAKVHWEAALRTAGANPDKLLTLGRYAQSDGASDTAEAAFRAAVKATPTNRAAHEALLGLLEAQGRTRDARTALRAMLTVWPEDSAIRNDDAYLSALLGEDLTAARDTARELVRLEPASLPHRVTLALTELRLGHELTALETLQTVGVNVLGGQPRFLAVYAGVLWQTAQPAEARRIADGLANLRLLPEERLLANGPPPEG